jgi:hypothetical protein
MVEEEEMLADQRGLDRLAGAIWRRWYGREDADRDLAAVVRGGDAMRRG